MRKGSRSNGVCPAADARQLLRRAGLRATAQRCAIAWLLTTGPSKHATADSLHEAARKAKLNVSLSSIYNILKQFTDAGILKQRRFPGGIVIYDVETADHQHVLVEGTGEVRNLEGDQVRIVGLPEIPDGYELDGYELLVVLRREP